MAYSNITSVDKTKKRPPKLSDDDVRLIFDMYRCGKSLREIGRKVGIRRGSVKWRLQKNKIDEHGNVVEINRNRKSTLNSGSFDYEKFYNHSPSELAYWAGFIMADGCVHKNNLSIVIHTKDAVILEWWKQFGVKIHHYNSKGCYGITPIASVSINNTFLIEWANNWGIFPKKTGNEIFPINKESKLIFHWLRGLIDGDGHVSIFRNNLSTGLCSASSEFLKSIGDFLSKYNIKSNFTSSINKSGKTNYKIIWAERASFRLYKLIYAPLCLSRKWNKFNQIFEYKKRCKHISMTDDEVKNVLSLRKKGLTIRAIAKITHRSPSGVKYRINQEVANGI